MRKSLVGFLCLVAVLFLAGMATGSGSEEASLCIPVGVLTLEAPEGVEARRSPVEFPHDLHFTYRCQECHHTWEGEAELYGCMECHDQTEPPEKADSPDAIYYYKEAYHQGCISCHKSIAEENEKRAASGQVLKDQLPPSGPTGCSGCHPRE
jgi:hypothetical protein